MSEWTRTGSIAGWVRSGFCLLPVFSTTVAHSSDGAWTQTQETEVRSNALVFNKVMVGLRGKGSECKSYCRIPKVERSCGGCR